jgi:hypothetical protein
LPNLKNEIDTVKNQPFEKIKEKVIVIMQSHGVEEDYGYFDDDEEIYVDNYDDYDPYDNYPEDVEYDDYDDYDQDYDDDVPDCNDYDYDDVDDYQGDQYDDDDEW